VESGSFYGITDGITIVDEYYRVLMVNDAVCRWQNKPLEFFLDKPARGLSPAGGTVLAARQKKPLPPASQLQGAVSITWEGKILFSSL